MAKRKPRRSQPAKFYYKPKSYRSVEEWPQYKRLILTFLGIALTLTFVYFIGIPFLSNLDDFWRILKGQSPEEISPVQKDIIAPYSPRLNALPKITNEKEISVSGFTEAGAKVKLFLNGEDYSSVLADKEGEFSFEKVPLKKDKNTIYVIAIDNSGNESDPSATHEVIYDEKAPEIEIEEPKEGSVFEGKAEQTIQILGLVTKGARILINESQAIVDDEGNFSYFFTLDKGENKIKIEAIDPAGNKAEEELTVIYNPEKKEEKSLE